MAAKLYVGNLPPSVTDAQLVEFATNAGVRVTSAGVVREKSTGTPWGFGYVNLPDGEDLPRALASLKGKVIGGQMLTLIAAKPRGTGFARASGMAKIYDGCHMPDNARAGMRPSERKQVQIAVTLVIESDEAEYVATAVDLSHYGLRLQSDATLTPGQSVGLLLATVPACLIKARVAWVGKADSAQAGQAGFQFMNPLSVPVC
jgi:hypothetical protein